MPTSSNLLTDWIEAARVQLPELVLSEDSGALTLQWGRKRLKLAPERIQNFTRGELEDLEGSYLDLGTGLLCITEPGILIRVRVSFTPARLTPLLACILARGLFPRLQEDVVQSQVRPSMLMLVGKQTLLAREWSRALGANISPMAISRLLSALRSAGLLKEDVCRVSELELVPSLELVRSEFRINGVGRSESYRFAQEDAGPLAEQLGTSLVWGTSLVLSQLAGGWVEPQDVLIDPSGMGALQELLGPPVKASGSDLLIVRPASRIPLSLLVEQQAPPKSTGVLNPILAACDGLSSDDPVRRQLARQLWDRWTQS
ncbi:MAG: hypothetical protein JKY61_12970 [Planctomycetes bacterium]|nr:hypothetical protein [Planctomycetota bacterium]